MVFFIDLDGTLVDSLPLLYSIYMQFLARYGLKGSKEEFAEINGPSLREGIALLQRRHNLPDDVHALYEESMEAIRTRYCQEVQLFPGAAAFLRRAKEQGAKMALVTSADRASAERILDRVDIADCFDAVVSSDGLLKSKPDPAIYLKALSTMGVSAADSIAIEDVFNGVVAAQAAGLPVVWMTHRQQNGDIEGVLAKVNSWDEASQLLLHV